VADVAGLTAQHLRESNLIENIDDPAADAAMEEAWLRLARRDRLTLETVLYTHQLITAAQLGDHAGRLRQVRVMVGGRICPPQEQVSGLLADWLRDMQRWKELDPQAMHVKFEHIHPFIDGNGRTGRLLLWWHQIRLGQAPILLRASERWDYYEWFREPGEFDEYARYLLRKIDQDGGGEG
jgi:Fic family protein